MGAVRDKFSTGYFPTQLDCLLISFFKKEKKSFKYHFIKILYPSALEKQTINSPGVLFIVHKEKAVSLTPKVVCSFREAWREYQQLPIYPFSQPAAMQGLMWRLCALLCLSLWQESYCRSSREARRTKEPSLHRSKRAPLDPDAKKCSYTFLVPEQRITGRKCYFSKSTLSTIWLN